MPEFRNSDRSKPDFNLRWEGDDVIAAVEQNVIEAVDVITERGAEFMAEDAPWRSGDLAQGMHHEPAKLEGDEIVGRFGADEKQFYASAVEFLHPTKAGFMHRAAARAFKGLDDELRKRAV